MNKLFYQSVLISYICELATLEDDYELKVAQHYYGHHIHLTSLPDPA